MSEIIWIGRIFYHKIFFILKFLLVDEKTTFKAEVVKLIKDGAKKNTCCLKNNPATYTKRTFYPSSIQKIKILLGQI